MSNKNKYNSLKKIDSVKIEINESFEETILYGPPILISTWEELGKLENEKYRIEVDLRWCNGNIVEKNSLLELKDEFYHYLSTHTFYDKTYLESTKLLQSLGFNVQLANWEGETIYYK